MQVSSYRIFTTPEGQRIDTNNNHAPDAADPILVHSTDDGFKSSSVDAPVDHDTMSKDFGFWQDKQISHKEGWWWDRKEVIDRPVDGKIQPDEVDLATPARLRDGMGGYSNTFYLGAEVNKDAQGRLTLSENYLSFGPYTVIGSAALATVNAAIENPSNWQVAVPTRG